MSSAKKKILIVDDSATARAHVVRELASEFECVTATSGQEAIELLASVHPDAVVTDLQMTNMSGSELLRVIKSNPATKMLPVIVVTTSTAVDEMNVCLTLGCAGFVLKPADGNYLRFKLRRLLSASAA